MRILLLSENRKKEQNYIRAAEEREDVRLCTVKNVPQALERMFRLPFDALLFDNPLILNPQILERPVMWPVNLFLLTGSPLRSMRLPDELTYCFFDGSDPKEVLSVVCTFPKGQRRRNDTECRISHFLQRLGVPVSLYGFPYLSEAIRLVLTNDRFINTGSMNDLYEVLSVETDLSASVIAHAMHHAIGVAWIRADSHTLDTVFGYSVDAERATPSNAAFVFRAADCMKMTIGEE